MSSEKKATNLSLKRSSTSDEESESLPDPKKFISPVLNTNDGEIWDFTTAWDSTTNSLFSENADDQSWRPIELIAYRGEDIKEKSPLPVHFKVEDLKFPLSIETYGLKHSNSLEEMSKRINEDSPNQIFKATNKPPKEAKTGESKIVATRNIVADILDKMNCISLSPSIADKYPQYQSNIEEVSIFDSAFVAVQQENNNSQSNESSVISDTRKRERIISETLQLLESQIQNYDRQLNSIPPWSQSLSNVIKYYLVKRLDVMADSPKYTPLSEFREEFVELLVSLKIALVDFFEDISHILSTYDVGELGSVIDCFSKFHSSIKGKYKNILNRYEKLRGGHPNYPEIPETIKKHFTKCYGIVCTFEKAVVDLFQSIKKLCGTI